jgi:hypothetical protein
MKYFKLSIAALLTLFIGVANSLHAQTIILEQDGAQNEFVPGDWTISGGGFANPDQVNITNGGSGNLAISNSNTYTDISVEIHFSQAVTISFDLALLEGGSVAQAENGNVSDATGAVNTAIVNFNNSTPINLNEIDFSNPNMTIGITYLKITGTLDGTSSLVTENQNHFQIGASNKTIFIKSELDGNIEIYDINGRKEFSSDITKGKTELNQNNLEGLHFVVLKNKAGEILRRQKVILI